MFDMTIVLREIVNLDTPISKDTVNWWTDRATRRLHADKNCTARSRTALAKRETCRQMTVKDAFTECRICDKCIDNIALPSGDDDEIFQNALALSCIDERIQDMEHPTWEPSNVMPLLAAWRRNHLINRNAEAVKKDLAEIKVCRSLRPWATRLRNRRKVLKAVTIDRGALDAEMLHEAALNLIIAAFANADNLDTEPQALRMAWCALVRQGQTPLGAARRLLTTSPLGAKMGETVSRYELQKLARYYKTLTNFGEVLIVGIVEGQDSPIPIGHSVSLLAYSKYIGRVVFSAVPRTFGSAKHVFVCHPTIWKFIQQTGDIQAMLEKPRSSWEVVMYIKQTPATEILESTLCLWEPYDTTSAYHRLANAYSAAEKV